VSRLASVVVPVYNGMPHLTELTRSLLAQSYANLEIIFSEGGSTDGSAEFLATLDDPRVRVITPGNAVGAAANWTAASRAAAGDYVKLVCQDDLLGPEAVALQVLDLDAEPSAVMAIAQRDIVDASGSVLYARRGGAGLSAGLMRGSDVVRACYLAGTNVIGEPLAVLFRREPFLDALPWDDRNPLVLDLMFYAAVAKAGDVVVRKESIGAFRVSGSSWSTRLVSVQREQFEQWQREYEASLPTPPGTAARARARVGLHTQALLRRGAYRWLRMKGSFHSG
jgi:glycosyltransferase involved in cell wall biosynthesis